MRVISRELFALNPTFVVSCWRLNRSRVQQASIWHWAVARLLLVLWEHDQEIIRHAHGLTTDDEVMTRKHVSRAPRAAMLFASKGRVRRCARRKRVGRLVGTNEYQYQHCMAGAVLPSREDSPYSLLRAACAISLQSGTASILLLCCSATSSPEPKPRPQL